MPTGGSLSVRATVVWWDVERNAEQSVVLAGGSEGV